ncbi:MAG: hypothetical protein ACOC7N_02635 [Chloroflexota bacterium]
MRDRAEGAGCIPQIIALLSIVACVVVGLLAFGVLRLRPLESGEIRLEAVPDPTTARAGDVVTYTVTMYNVEVRDGLEIITVTDSLLGDLSGAFASNLAEGTSDREVFTRVVQPTDTDPLSNTVTVYATADGKIYSDTARVEVEILKPVLQVDAAVDPVTAAPGEAVKYTVSVANVGDVPLRVITVTDSLLGDLSASFGPTLTAGISQVQDFEWVFPTDETEPRDRTVTAYAAGSGEVVSGTAVARLELARPALRVLASLSPPAAVPGGSVTMTVTISNTGGIDLEDVQISDSELGDISPSFSRILPAGTVETRTFAWPVPPDAAGALDRTVTVSASGAGEEVEGIASSTLSIAGLEVAATGSPSVQIGERATFTVTITNTGSHGAPDLVLDRVTDFQGRLTEELPDRCRVIPNGEVCTFSYQPSVPSDVGSFTNAIEVRYRPAGLTDVIAEVASHTVEIFQLSISVEKSGPAEAIEGQDVTYTLEIANTSSDGAPDLVLDRVADRLMEDLDPGREGVTTTCTDRLASGDRCRISYVYTPGAGDPRPLLNTVLVESYALGSTRVVTAEAEHTLVVLSPWRRATGIPTEVQVRTLGICLSESEVLYAGFGSLGMGVYRSADAGETWSATALRDEEVFGIAVDPGDCGTVYAAAWRDGVIKSGDGGRTWDVVSDGLEGAFVYSVVVDPTNRDVLYAGTAQRGIYRSEDAGATWRAWGLQPLTAPQLDVAADGRVVIAATWGEGIYRRERRGTSWGAWSAVNNGIPSVHQDVYGVAMDPEDRATVFAATAAGGIYRSTDGGGTWEQVLSAPPPVYTLAVEPGDTGVVYAGTGEGVRRSQELGDVGSWEPFDAGLEELAIRALVIGFDYLHLGSTDGVWRRAR